MLPAIRVSDAAQLERIGSRDPAKAARFADEFGCSKCGSYEAVLSDPDVDAVYISTPPALHEPWARAAAEHGKHVLCEKPAFTSRHVAVELIDLCRRQNVRLMEGYMFGYHPQHAVVRSLLDAGRIGKPGLVQSEFTMPRPDEGSFRLQRELGGGIFLDAAGYPVAVAMLVFRTLPISVYCRVQMDAGTGIDTAVSIMLDFPGGEFGHAMAAYGLHYRSQYSVHGTEGRIEVARAFSVLPDRKTEIIVEAADGTEIIPVAPVDQCRLMLEDFCAQVADACRSITAV